MVGRASESERTRHQHHNKIIMEYISVLHMLKGSDALESGWSRSIEFDRSKYGERVLYMQIPKQIAGRTRSFTIKDGREWHLAHDDVLLLSRPLYGLADSPRRWQETIFAALEELGPRRIKSDNDIFIWEGESGHGGSGGDSEFEARNSINTKKQKEKCRLRRGSSEPPTSTKLARKRRSKKAQQKVVKSLI